MPLPVSVDKDPTTLLEFLKVIAPANRKTPDPRDGLTKLEEYALDHRELSWSGYENLVTKYMNILEECRGKLDTVVQNHGNVSQQDSIVDEMLRYTTDFERIFWIVIDNRKSRDGAFRWLRFGRLHLYVWSCLRNIPRYSDDCSDEAAQTDLAYKLAKKLASSLPETDDVRLAIAYHRAKFSRDVRGYKTKSCKMLAKAIKRAEDHMSHNKLPQDELSGTSLLELRKLRETLESWKETEETSRPSSFAFHLRIPQGLDPFHLASS